MYTAHCTVQYYRLLRRPHVLPKWAYTVDLERAIAKLNEPLVGPKAMVSGCVANFRVACGQFLTVAE